jgi:hypothetical protein
VSSIRLETFSDGVFAIAVTLLALQLRPPNLGGATSAHAVLHALAQQGRQFGFYVLAFLLTGGLWIEHHQLLDPLETHGRRLPRANLWFLLTVSLLPYWVSVLATYPNNSGCPTRWSSAGWSCWSSWVVRPSACGRTDGGAGPPTGDSRRPCSPTARWLLALPQALPRPRTPPAAGGSVTVQAYRCRLQAGPSQGLQHRGLRARVGATEGRLLSVLDGASLGEGAAAPGQRACTASLGLPPLSA